MQNSRLRPLYLGFSSQKGGVGKRTLAKILSRVLQDLHERVSMVSYINNVIREHLRAHRELLNQASTKQRRKTKIPL